jgi:salicylate hydroxylase
VLKWRLCHQEELVRWTEGNVVIIGDASHPTLPYQAQGAAMAVEDGAVIGHLLGRLRNVSTSDSKPMKHFIPAVLKLFERLRKHRTTVNVRGAVNNQRLFHMADDAERQERDQMLQKTNWKTQTQTVFSWNDLSYQSDMLGFDVIADADRAFDEIARHDCTKL